MEVLISELDYRMLNVKKVDGKICKYHWAN